MNQKVRYLLIASILGIGMGYCNDVESRSTPLYLKPVFELTEKDQVLLDILQTDDIASTREDFSYLEEKNAKYPDAFERAYEKYIESIGNARPTRARYGGAIQEAAKYLFELLFPGSHAKPEEESAATVEQKIARGDLATLLIGINYEGSPYELENCIHDIEHVQKYFLKPYLKAKDANTVFMSDHQKGTSLYPTAKNIRNQFDAFVKKLNQSKQGYFHYSGHGSYLRDTSNDEKDRRDEVLVPVDSNYSGYIRDDEIFQTLVENVGSDVKLTVTSDCCHSGTVMDLPYKWNVDGSFSEEANYTEGQLKSFPDVVMISGCKDTQTSADGGAISGETKGAGAMTAAFIETLKEHNYLLTYRELITGIRDWLSREGFSQVPQLTSTRKLDLDDFYLASEVTLRP